MQFVIQEYRSGSNKVRYYLRLEKDGVFKGWAIPKGLPIKWKEQHLAIQVGNFKLEAAGFEGKVEKSKFGPGTITILDRGEYRVRSWEDNKIIFDLSGSRAKGSFALIRFPRPGPGHWLLGQTKPLPQPPSLKNGRHHHFRLLIKLHQSNMRRKYPLKKINPRNPLQSRYGLSRPRADHQLKHSSPGHGPSPAAGARKKILVDGLTGRDV